MALLAVHNLVEVYQIEVTMRSVHERKVVVFACDAPTCVETREAGRLSGWTKAGIESRHGEVQVLYYCETHSHLAVEYELSFKRQSSDSRY